MARRLVNLTLDTLADLPRPCRDCVFWELDPIVARDAQESGDPGLEKEAWVSQTLLEWGSCGKLVYEGATLAGYVMYAPPRYLPRSALFPTAPVSADAVLLTVVHVVPAYAEAGIARMLVQAAAGHMVGRGVRALEVFGDASPGEPDELGITDGRCLAPADFYRAVGFKTVRAHPRFPRLRLELRDSHALRSEVEYALDTLLESGPAAPVVRQPTRLSAPAVGRTPSGLGRRQCRPQS